MRYKNIIKDGKKVSFEEAELKFPWLKEASFEDADIDISSEYLIWHSGIWLGGIWKNGFMWDNLEQGYRNVKWNGKTFEDLK